MNEEYLNVADPKNLAHQILNSCFYASRGVIILRGDKAKIFMSDIIEDLEAVGVDVTKNTASIHEALKLIVSDEYNVMVDKDGYCSFEPEPPGTKQLRVIAPIVARRLMFYLS